MTEGLSLIGLAVLLWVGIALVARGLYRRARVDVPVLWLLCRERVRRWQ
jgi:hypothetical protein